MFTGIIEEQGNVKGIIRKGKSLRISIACSKVLDDLEIGDSIAVDGICLTVVAKGETWFSTDVMPETMMKTGLKKLQIFDQVNLERALRLTDRLGGHIVTGHIDGTGVIKDRKEEDNAIWLTIEASKAILKYIVVKGSVALDGTSLTVARVGDGYFQVSLIPLTRSFTTLGSKKVSDWVNVECDLIGKYVEKMVNYNIADQKKKKDISLEFLINQGFV